MKNPGPYIWTCFRHISEKNRDKTYVAIEQIATGNVILGYLTSLLDLPLSESLNYGKVQLSPWICAQHYNFVSGRGFRLSLGLTKKNIPENVLSGQIAISKCWFLSGPVISQTNATFVIAFNWYVRDHDIPTWSRCIVVFSSERNVPTVLRYPYMVKN